MSAVLNGKESACLPGTSPEESLRLGGAADANGRSESVTLTLKDAPTAERPIRISGRSKEIAVTRSHALRSHGAVIVRGPIFEEGLWRIYLVPKSETRGNS